MCCFLLFPSQVSETDNFSILFRFSPSSNEGKYLRHYLHLLFSLLHGIYDDEFYVIVLMVFVLKFYLFILLYLYSWVLFVLLHSIYCICTFWMFLLRMSQSIGLCVWWRRRRWQWKSSWDDGDNDVWHSLSPHMPPSVREAMSRRWHNV